MNIKNQLCLPEQAHKLYKLGIKNEAALFWVDMEEPDTVYFKDGKHSLVGGIPLFTVAELGIMLPDLLTTTSQAQYELVCIKEADDEWLCRYCRNNNMLDKYPQLPSFAGKTEAQARAAELIYLLQTNNVTPEECNKRLTD